jgi:hypothetical protein
MASKAKVSKKRTQSPKKLRLIVSDEKSPAVELKAGMKLDVVAVTLIEPTLKKSKAVAARLCGGTSTCLALVDVGDEI